MTPWPHGPMAAPRWSKRLRTAPAAVSAFGHGLGAVELRLLRQAQQRPGAFPWLALAEIQEVGVLPRIERGNISNYVYNIYIYTGSYVYIYIYRVLCIYIYIYRVLCIYIYRVLCIYIYIYITVCIFVCACVCIYICIFMDTGVCVCVSCYNKQVLKAQLSTFEMQGDRALWCYSVQRSYASEREASTGHKCVPANMF